MKQKIEKQEKGKRRNVIINIKLKKQEAEREVEVFMEEKLNVQIKVKKAYEIKKGIVIAKISDWEQKKIRKKV